MKTMTEYVKNKILSSTYAIAIDFTMGNGNDTLTLSKVSKKVYSFDIQELALKNTKELIKGINNVELILDSHENFDKYINSYDIGVFNLGYLPQGDHHITTMVDTTLIAIDKAVKHLNKDGHLYIVVYIGHDEGKKESIKVDEYVSNLDHQSYNVALYKMMNKQNAPYVIEIEKRK